MSLHFKFCLLPCRTTARKGKSVITIRYIDKEGKTGVVRASEAKNRLSAILETKKAKIIGLNEEIIQLSNGEKGKRRELVEFR